MIVSLVIQAVLLTFALFVLIFFVYLVLFYGFAPFFPSRSEEIRKIIKEIRIRGKSNIYSLGGGSSGFLRVLEEHYPDLALVGVEDSFIFYLAARVQIFLKRSRIKVVKSDYYRVDIKKADVIYCYLSLNDIREIHKRLKIDAKPDALIISNGFVIPYLYAFLTVELKEKRRWFRFFARGKKVVRTSQDEARRDSKVYYYQV